MNAPISAPTEVPVPLDPAATEVLRLAAHLGAQVSDDVFVSYTTLLLGLLLAPLPTSEPWRQAAAKELPLDAILASRSGMTRADVERVVSGMASGRFLDWPTGRPLLSVSARNVLQEAAKRSGDSGGTPLPVTPAAIMASYIHAIPDAHKQQAARWGLAGEAGQRIAALLPRPTPAPEPETGDLPGYDVGASRILKTALALAGHRRGERRPLIVSETLLVAIIEATPRLEGADSAEAAVLRGMAAADDAASPYRRQRDAAFDLPADLAAASRRAGPDWPPLSHNAQRILEAAREMAQRASASTVVGTRHLIAALVSEPDGTDRASTASGWMRNAGVEPDRLREALARIVAGWHGTDDHAAWQRILLGTGPPLVALVQPDTIPEDPRAADRLGLRRYADAIGALIAASAQQPPLSIAVFGSWGSGKSFFMAMIRAAVRDFQRPDLATHPTDAPVAFLRRIVQIEFNAWHYVEGNLWASLVHAILVGLQQAMAPEPDRSPFQQVLDRLNLHEAARVEAEAQLRDAERRLEEARAAMRQADQQLAARRGDEGNVVTVDAVLHAVREEALAAIGPTGDRTDAEAWIRSVGDSVAKAATYLGRPELTRGAEALTEAGAGAAGTAAAMQVKIGAVRELLDEAHASAQRGLGLLGWLANARPPAGGMLKLALSGVALLLALLLAALLLERHGAQITAAITGLVALLAPLLGAAGAAIGWARRHLAEATRALAVLGSVRERVEAHQAQQLSERDAELLAARRSLSEAEAEAGRRRAEHEAALAAVAKARQELREATSPERLKRFVAQRLAEGDYQRHLGLIHTIRGDLERLEGILRDVHPKEAELAGETPVQRIVLYIDDLDRCPPARVVEVLEAVHLLLAFRLFVVVVGVDVRWVAQALHERYPRQLGSTAGVASPMDYLEKVFQIPFWLPAMDAGAGRELLDSAIGQAARVARQETATESGADGQAAQGMAAEGTPAAADRSAQPHGVTQLRPADTEAAAEALQIDATERERLLELAEAVGASPRRTKRFANLYRLLKASLAPAERRSFVLAGGGGGSFAAAQLLLAATTGAPRGARALIEALREPPGEDPASWLAACFDRAAAALPPAEQAAFGAARSLALAAADPAGQVEHLRFWAPRVTRFVFDGQGPRRQAGNPVQPPAPAVAAQAAAPGPVRRRSRRPSPAPKPPA